MPLCACFSLCQGHPGCEGIRARWWETFVTCSPGLIGMSPGPSQSGTCTHLLPLPGHFGPDRALLLIFPHHGDDSGRRIAQCHHLGISQFSHGCGRGRKKCLSHGFESSDTQMSIFAERFQQMCGDGKAPQPAHNEWS